MNEKSSEVLYKLMGDYDVTRHPVLWEREQAVREHLTELETRIEVLEKQIFDIVWAGNELYACLKEASGEDDDKYFDALEDWGLEVDEMDRLLEKKESNEKK